MTKKVLKFLLTAAIVASGTAAHAADLDVPKDELTQETVYPVFDNPVSVKNRNVQDSGAVDIGVFGGLALTEPISSATKFGADINYHFNHIHSIGVFFAKNTSGLSRDAQGLKDQFGLDFNRAPKLDYTFMADYNYKAFYGKLSLTSNGVINTTIYGSFAGGMVKYVHKSYPALAVGIGERFYFTKSLSLKLDLRFYAHTAPIPFKAGVLRDGSQGTPVDPIPDYGSFEERLTYTTNLEVGLNYLF